MYNSLTPYLTFPRKTWSELGKNETLTLTEEEIIKLRGILETLSMTDVCEVYLPLSRLLNNYVHSTISRQVAMMKFLNKEYEKIPFIIGVAGSVSVGKSTVSRVLQALLSRWTENFQVALVTTDGFLFPNAELNKRGLMEKKGFPESYDIRTLINFVSDIKSGKQEVSAPVYSHLQYDILPDSQDVISPLPDILILEGLNVLQNRFDYPDNKPTMFVSDFLDFSIYVDAEENNLEEWFLTRFMQLRQTAFNDSDSFFYPITMLSDEKARQIALDVWKETNSINLHKNILPTRERANLILHKGKNHKVDYVKLRK